MDVVDVLITLGTLAKHDRVAALGVYIGGTEER
jgi:hypothetical protein